MPRLSGKIEILIYHYNNNVLGKWTTGPLLELPISKQHKIYRNYKPTKTSTERTNEENQRLITSRGSPSREGLIIYPQLRMINLIQ